MRSLRMSTMRTVHGSTRIFTGRKATVRTLDIGTGERISRNQPTRSRLNGRASSLSYCDALSGVRVASAFRRKNAVAIDLPAEAGSHTRACGIEGGGLSHALEEDVS